MTDQDKWKEGLEAGAAERTEAPEGSRDVPAAASRGASRDNDLDDDDGDEVAPIGNRRSEPPTSGSLEDLAEANNARRGRRGAEPQPTTGGGRGRGSLAADDPFWQFGTPVELWGSTRPAAGPPAGARKPGGGRPATDAKRRYLECRRCGVKIEAKRTGRQQQRGKMACPTCGRGMESR